MELANKAKQLLKKSVKKSLLFKFLIKILKKIYLFLRKYKLLKNNDIKLGKNVKLYKPIILSNIYGGKISIGDNTELVGPLQIMTYGGNIEVGANCSINPNTVIYGHGGTKIGDNVLIAGGCMIIPANHLIDDLTIPISQQGISKKGITIESDVWIGHGCSILDGVKIGKGAVVAAGSVVNKHVKPYEIVAGIPARKIDFRFFRKSKCLNAQFNEVENLFEVDYQLNGHILKLVARERTSDLHMFKQIFYNEEYKPIIDLFKRNNKTIKIVFDCGANVGYTSCYILSFFPDAFLHVFEPDYSNFQILNKNLSANFKPNSLKKYELNEVGLWSSPGNFYLSKKFRDGTHCALQVTNEQTDIQIKTIKLYDYILSKNITQIDYLKIDIEGAEWELLQNDQDFENVLKICQCVSIEVHEEFGHKTIFEDTLKKLSFNTFYTSESLVGFKF
jgi:FkbM family methyltransferase